MCARIPGIPSGLVTGAWAKAHEHHPEPLGWVQSSARPAEPQKASLWAVHPVGFDEKILVSRRRPHGRKVDVDNPIAVEVVPVRLRRVEEPVAVGVDRGCIGGKRQRRLHCGRTARWNRDAPAEPDAVVDVHSALTRVGKLTVGRDRQPEIVVERLDVVTAGGDWNELLDPSGRRDAGDAPATDGTEAEIGARQETVAGAVDGRRYGRRRPVRQIDNRGVALLPGRRRCRFA